MIINISGTSGTGKSTFVREIMKLYKTQEPCFVDGRKRPIGYQCEHPTIPEKWLWVTGHYETPCGGCDTLSNIPGFMDYTYEIIRDCHAKDVQDVIYEGLLIESDVNRCVALHNDGFPVIVLSLDIPIEICLENIRKRRLARGNTKPFNEKNTRGRNVQVKRRVERLKNAGVDARLLNWDEAMKVARLRLGLGW